MLDFPISKEFNICLAQFSKSLSLIITINIFSM